MALRLSAVTNPAQGMSAQRERIAELRIDRDERQRGARPRGALLTLAVLLVVLAGAVFWWLGRSTSPVVQVAEVATGSADGPVAERVLDASGYVVARLQATVSSKITGKITEVLVEEGMAVTEGQVLARLDDAIPQRRLELAEARMESTRRALQESEVRLEEAGINLDRARRLAEAEVGTEADLDAAEALVEALEARIALGRQEIAVAESEVALQRQELADTVIRAPFTGVAVSKNAQPGEMISPVSAGGGFTRTGVCTLVDMQSLEIEVDVNEAYINRVSPAQRVVATLDAYPDWRIPASVITTVPTADRQKATVRVRIAFDELDPRILPDMGVKVSFLDEEVEEPAAAAPRTTIPATAVRRDGDVDIALVVVGEVVERRAIRLGAREGERFEVLAGLRPGERVIVAGPSDLQAGDRVKVEEKASGGE